jgi:hypothetical protein
MSRRGSKGKSASSSKERSSRSKKPVGQFAFLRRDCEFLRYVEARQADPGYELYIKGQLVWLRQDKTVVRGVRPMEGPVYRPAKVKRSFERGAAPRPSDAPRGSISDVAGPEAGPGGVLMIKEHGAVKDVAVDAATSLEVVPMVSVAGLCSSCCCRIYWQSWN